MKQIEARYGPKARLIDYACAALFGLLALMGLFILFPLRDESVLGVLCALGFGWAASVMARRQLSGHAPLVLDDEGLTFLAMGRPVKLAWKELERAEVGFDAEHEAVLLLWVRDRATFKARLPFEARLLKSLRRNREPGKGDRDAFVNLARLVYEPRELFDAIQANAAWAWDSRAAEELLARAGEPADPAEGATTDGAPAEDAPPAAETDQGLLQKLAELHARGVITDEEFEAKKIQLQQGG